MSTPGTDPGTPAAGGDGGGPATVTREEHQRIKGELELTKRQAVKDREAWTQRETELTGTHAKTLAEIENTWKAKDAAKDEKLAIVFAGIRDAEGVELAQLAYGRVPAEERPAGGIGEWLKSGKAPRGLAAYLDAPGAPPLPAAGGGAPSTGGGLPPSNAKTAPSNPGGQPPATIEQIQNMNDPAELVKELKRGRS